MSHDQGAILALFYALLHAAWHWIYPSTHSCKHGCHDPLDRRLSKAWASNQGPQCSVESVTATGISGILHHQPSLLRRSHQAGLTVGRHTLEARLDLSLLEKQRRHPKGGMIRLRLDRNILPCTRSMLSSRRSAGASPKSLQQGHRSRLRTQLTLWPLKLTLDHGLSWASWLE